MIARILANDSAKICCVHFALYTVLLASLGKNKKWLGGIIMPTGFIYKCTNCGYAVTLSGIWEFYIDEFGLRQRYGHLGRSAAAQKAGVMGFSVLWYCSQCKSVRDVVVIEFNESQNDPLPALMAYYDRPETKHEEFEPICDKCGGKLTDDIRDELCPKCNVGHFKEEGRFMS